jgi:FkbM family methyltransferase
VAYPLTKEGYLALPSSIHRVWIDVGSSALSFSDTCGVCVRSFWKGRGSLQEEFTTSSDLFTIAIDPNPAYFDRLSALGNHTLAITAAVSLREGTAMFNNFAGPGCSSLLAPSDRVPTMEGGHPCRVVDSATSVPLLRLDSILRLVPPTVPIELLKVDAQGGDLDAVQSAGVELPRIATLIVEVQAVAETLLYKSQPLAATVREWVEGTAGFTFDADFSFEENEEVAEANYVFRNSP